MLRTGWSWRWRRNALRRRWDVIEAWLGLVVALGLLLAVPVVAVAVTLTVHSGLSATMREQHQQRHPVQAILLQDAPKPPPAADSMPDQLRYDVKVGWTAADGSRHTGLTGVSAGQKKGSSTTAWLDGAGRLADPPISNTKVLGESLAAGFSAGSGTVLVLLGSGWAVRRGLDRRRLDAWDRDWAEVEPRWRHRQI
jgi:hypothetical protein